MMRAAVSLVLCFLLLVEAAQIKHVVVVVLENNSFDRIFGHFPGARGLNGSEWNRNKRGEKVFVSKEQSLLPVIDPNHDVNATTYKIYGFPPNFTSPSMDGFVLWEEIEDKHGPKGGDVMGYFLPHQLPVINFLASEFALFDHFFPSIPGPTWCNRFFMLSATSEGDTRTEGWYQNQRGHLYPSKTIMDQLREHNLTSKIYYQTTPWEVMLASVLHHPDELVHYDAFLKDCKRGTLPSFAYINPRSGVDSETGYGSNDGHPRHDMALSEAFLKEIYEAVRASPQWEETALVITFDEHGGFYDHVPPPSKDVPSPDGKIGVDGFDFRRLGVRIPTIVASAFTPKGLIVHEPPASMKPFPSSQYDHTSVMATVRSLLGVPGHLTQRDAWAARFDHVFSLSSPRDAPLHTPAPPRATLLFAEEAALPVSDLQLSMLEHHRLVSGLSIPAPRTQGQVHRALKRHFLRAISRVRAADKAYEVLVRVALSSPGIVESGFVMDKLAKRIRTKTLKHNGVHFCFTSDLKAAFSLQICRMGVQGQEFRLLPDGSMRDAKNNCVTVVRDPNDAPTLYGNYTLSMVPCSPLDSGDLKLRQSFGYYGMRVAGGQTNNDGIVFGDGASWLVVMEKKEKR